MSPVATTTLRPYQQSAIAAVSGLDSAVLQMPTGAGKTRTAAEIIAGEPGIVWFIGHRREIVRQASAALAARGIEHALATPGRRPNPAARIQVCSVGAMRRRMLSYPAPALIVIDEAHHIGAATWAALLAAYPNARHIGLTATPERLDGQGLDNWFDNLVCGPSIAELMYQGHLAPYKLYAPSRPTLEGVPLVRRDYAPAESDKVMTDPRIVGDAVAHYQLHASGKRALAFTTSIPASRALVARFNAAGIPAAHIDGSMPVKVRDAAIADLAAGRILVLSNFGVLTEGFDLPSIDAVILLRPTKSLGLFLQMVGRCLRPSEGKPHAIILDHAGLVFEHGFPDEDRAWSLEGGAASARRIRKRKVFVCPSCASARRSVGALCSCGYQWPASAIREAEAGILEEIHASERAASELADEKAKVDAIVAEAMRTFVPQESFARIIGKSRSVVSRLVMDGLPTNADGEIQVDVGLAWVADHPLPASRARVVHRSTGRPRARAGVVKVVKRHWWQSLRLAFG